MLQEPGLGLRDLSSTCGSAGTSSITVGKSHPSADYVSSVHFWAQVVPKYPPHHMALYHRERLLSVLEGMQVLVLGRPGCESWLPSSCSVTLGKSPTSLILVGVCKGRQQDLLPASSSEFQESMVVHIRLVSSPLPLPPECFGFALTGCSCSQTPNTFVRCSVRYISQIPKIPTS